MPFDPQAPTEEDRSRAFTATFVGLAGSVVTTVGAVFGWDNIVFTLALGAAIGGLIIAAFHGHSDDYFRSLSSVGTRWLAAALAIYLFCAFLIQLADLAYSIGFAASSGQVPESGYGSWTYLLDGPLVAAFLALVYHAGFAFAWLRDQLGGAE